TGLARSAICS
ncbi:hypothetical protein RU639_013738, partial [Aspergillus parasiticus]